MMSEKVKGSLAGINGNSASVIAHFNKKGRDQGFDQGWIDSVIIQAIAGDYSHVISTISDYMTGVDDDCTNKEAAEAVAALEKIIEIIKGLGTESAEIVGVATMVALEKSAAAKSKTTRAEVEDE